MKTTEIPIRFYPGYLASGLSEPALAFAKPMDGMLVDAIHYMKMQIRYPQIQDNLILYPLSFAQGRDNFSKAFNG